MIGNYVFQNLQSLDLDLENSDGTVRIYPEYVRMADKSYPQCVFSLDNYEPDIAMDGPVGTATIDLKIVAVDSTYSGADALGSQVANALDGTKGIWGDSDGLEVQGCFLSEMSNDSFVDTDMATILYYVNQLTFHVVFVVPT
jgi:hypothetical protein